MLSKQVLRLLAVIIYSASSINALYATVESNQTTGYDSIKPKPPPQDGKYEYILVGSGPGGGPLAARLAIAGHKVLLIDAGGDYGTTNGYKVPML